ncbi:8184_t:CDS:2, partial [Cetraspora pellucida]
HVNNNVENADIDGIDNDIQDSLCVITESPPHSPFSEMLTNILGNLHINIEHGVMQGIKVAVDNWLYPNDKVYEEAIRKELEILCPDKME